MKRIVTIAAAVVAVGIAGLFVSSRDDGHQSPEDPTPATTLSKLPAKTGRVDEDHHPARFDSLDDGMKETAEELEAAAIKWFRSRPSHESFHKLTHDWNDYSTSRVSELETGQIRQLAEWLEEGNYSELIDYRQAVFRIWASRDPAAVRAELIRRVGLLEFVGKEPGSSTNGHFEELSDNFHQFRIGHAIHDPKAAWETFLQDAADPKMVHFVDAGTTVPDLIRAYSSRSPDEAWDLVLTVTNEDYCLRMIEGFADGVPSGQDWEQKGLDLFASIASREFQVNQGAYGPIAERWMMENPDAALEWYVRTSSDVAEFQGEDPFEEDFVDSLTPDEIANRLKLDLITGMYRSHKDRTREAISALDHLAMHDSGLFSAKVVKTLIGDSLDPMDTPLLELIPKFPSREARSDLFFTAVNSIPTRTGSPFASDSLEGPNLTLEAVRELAAQLDLTPEIRAKAEEAFRRVEAAELHALKAQEQLRRSKSHANGDDPFSSR